MSDKIERMYERTEDLHLRTTTFYGASSEGSYYLYANSASTAYITPDVFMRAAELGTLRIGYDGSYLVPVEYGDSGSSDSPAPYAKTLAGVKVNTSEDATKFILWNLGTSATAS